MDTVCPYMEKIWKYGPGSLLGMWKDNEITATPQGAHGNAQRKSKCQNYLYVTSLRTGLSSSR